MDKKKGGLDNVKPLKPDFDKASRTLHVAARV